MPDPPPRAPSSSDQELIEAASPGIAVTRDDAERVRVVSAELQAGFRALARVGPAVSVFGSARSAPGAPDYERARAVGRAFGEAGFAPPGWPPPSRRARRR